MKAKSPAPAPRDDTITVPMARLFVRHYLTTLQQTDPDAAKELEAAIAVLLTNASAGQ